MIKFIADSTCDLSSDIVKSYGIDIIPLSINIEGKTYFDRIDIDSDEFLSMITDLKENPTTAMPSPSLFHEAYEKAYNEGVREFICITMSSGTSGSYQSAVIGEQMFLDDHEGEEIKSTVIDSFGMSHGSGFLIMKAIQLYNIGMNYDDLVAFCEDHKKNVKHFLSVDDLDNLIRSGRLSNTSALIGKMLKVKPIMTMKDKKGVICGKERGRKKVLNHYINYFNENVDLELTNFVIIGYTSDELYAENLKHKILSDTEFKGEIYIMQMGVAVSNHVGLGGLSFYFFENHEHHTMQEEISHMMKVQRERSREFNKQLREKFRNRSLIRKS